MRITLSVESVITAASLPKDFSNIPKRINKENI